MSKEKSQFENKVFLYTNDCTYCGDVFPSDEAKLRGLVEKAGKELYVKSVSLFHGWKEEAKLLEESFKVKVPFYYDFSENKVISWNKVYKRTENKYKPVELDAEAFREFLGGKKDVEARKSESFDSTENRAEN